MSYGEVITLKFLTHVRDEVKRANKIRDKRELGGGRICHELDDGFVRIAGTFAVPRKIKSR